MEGEILIMEVGGVGEDEEDSGVNGRSGKRALERVVAVGEEERVVETTSVEEGEEEEEVKMKSVESEPEP